MLRCSGVQVFRRLRLLSRGSRIGVILLILVILSEGIFISAAAAPPAVGSHAPAFALADVEGRTRALSGFKGRTVLLCFFCGCQACHDFARQWGRVQAAGRIQTPEDRRTAPAVTVIVYSGSAAELRRFARDTKLGSSKTVLLPDPGGRATRLYGALPCPRLCVIDSRSIVRYFNDHADDAPQQTPAGTLMTRVLRALRRPAVVAPDPVRSTQSAQSDRPDPSPHQSASPLTVLAQPGVTPRDDGGRCDFGFIDRLADPKAERTLTLRNNGKRDVVIDRIQPSCACIEATSADEVDQVTGYTLRPGQEIGLQMRLDVSQLTAGPIQKFVFVFQKWHATPAAIIEIDAMSRPVLAFSPDHLDFGRLRIGASRSLSFTVAIDSRLSAGTPPPELVCSNPNVRVTPREGPGGSPLPNRAASGSSSGTDRPGENGAQEETLVWNYVAMISPEASSGVLSGTITLALPAGTRDNAAQPEVGTPDRQRAAALLHSVSLPIRGEIIGEIAAAPAAVRLDVVHPGREAPHRVILSGRSAETVRTLRVSSDVPWLSLRLLPTSPAGSKIHRVLEIAFTSQAPAGPVQAQIVVTPSAGKRLVIPVTGYVVPRRIP